MIVLVTPSDPFVEWPTGQPRAPVSQFHFWEYWVATTLWRRKEAMKAQCHVSRRLVTTQREHHTEPNSPALAESRR